MIFGENWWFVQNPKVASSSITDALTPFTSPIGVHEPRGFTKHDFPTPGRTPLREYRLGVVRNPFDRLVSGWSYIREKRPGEWGDVSFRDFVINGGWWIGRKPHRFDFCRTPQMAWLATCNTVFRYENVGVQFGDWSEFHLGQRLDLDQTNQSHRSGGYAAYYTDDDGKLDCQLVNVVRQRFALDLRGFVYEF